MSTRVRWALGALVLLSAAAPLEAQRAQWSDVVYVPGRWQARRLVRLAAANAATDTLALVMRVDYVASPPRWRAEVRRSSDGTTFGPAEVLLGSGGTVQVVSPVGVIPFAQHALARDTLVRAAVAVMGSQGRRSGAANGRLVESAAGQVVRVVFRRSVAVPSFSDDLLSPSTRGGRDLLASRLQTVGDQRSASVVATAGARGVDRVQTPRGTIAVTPDTAAVARMEAFSVGALRLEEFIRAGRLGAYSTRYRLPEVQP